MGQTEACESVRGVATTWLQGNPSTRSAPWRLCHRTIGGHPARGIRDFDVASLRAKSLSLSPSHVFSLCVGSFFRNSLISREDRSEGNRYRRSRRLINLAENRDTSMHVHSRRGRLAVGEIVTKMAEGGKGEEGDWIAGGIELESIPVSRRDDQ